MLLQSEWHEHMMCTWTNVGNTKSMSKRLAILLRTLLQTDRQTDAEELWQKSIILRQTSCSSLCCWLLVLSSFSHTQPKIFACVFSPYTHTQNRERRIKGKSTKVFQSVLPMRMCVYVCKNERSLPAGLHRCVCVRLCDMHTFSIAFPLYVSILLRSLRLVVVIFLPILFCVISSSAVAVAAASALLYLHLRLSLCLFVLWKVQVFPVAFGPCQRRLWNTEMLQCCQQKCQCMCMLSACMYALFL